MIFKKHIKSLKTDFDPQKITLIHQQNDMGVPKNVIDLSKVEEEHKNKIKETPPQRMLCSLNYSPLPLSEFGGKIYN